MATVVFTDAFVSFDGVDISSHLKAVAFNYNAEQLDETAMGDDTRIRKGGLKDWSFEIEMDADPTVSGGTDEMFAKVGTTGTIIVRPDNSDGVGTNNPNWTGTGLLADFPPMSGAVGELVKARMNVTSAGTLTRATA